MESFGVKWVVLLIKCELVSFIRTQRDLLGDRELYSSEELVLVFFLNPL